MKLFISALIVFLTAYPILQAAESEDQIFVSEEQKFSLQYPKTWSRAETILTQTVIRLESPDGEDFNVAVTEIPQLKSAPVKEYTSKMLQLIETLISTNLSKQYPDIKLVSKGETTLSQQPALYYITDFTIHAAGRELPIRCYTLMTKHEDKQYTLTFRVPRPFYDEFFPTIQRLALGFQIFKNSIN